MFPTGIDPSGPLDVLTHLRQEISNPSSVRRPSSFSEKPELPIDDSADSALLTADLSTLNTLITDKISEIKRHRNEIDEIN